MANFELELESGYSKNPVKPITLSDGTVVKMEIIKDGEKKTMNGIAVKEEKEVATLRLNPDSNRLFIQVQPLDGVSSEVTVEIIEAFHAGIKYMFNN